MQSTYCQKGEEYTKHHTSTLTAGCNMFVVKTENMHSVLNGAPSHNYGPRDLTILQCSVKINTELRVSHFFF